MPVMDKMHKPECIPLVRQSDFTRSLLQQKCYNRAITDRQQDWDDALGVKNKKQKLHVSTLRGTAPREAYGPGYLLDQEHSPSPVHSALMSQRGLTPQSRDWLTWGVQPETCLLQEALLTSPALTDHPLDPTTLGVFSPHLSTKGMIAVSGGAVTRGSSSVFMCISHQLPDAE
ncbi:hypothetical protein JEQ12_013690 [Ovis aries]|uniref:Uncharacterized protein n=1 Tax=Ovis aries TaxID=9940 RepID=A0A836AJY1_SHEEP|nr:hypothetical protein JEQ12_013690 [Ovis aries]